MSSSGTGYTEQTSQDVVDRRGLGEKGDMPRGRQQMEFRPRQTLLKIPPLGRGNDSVLLSLDDHHPARMA